MSDTAETVTLAQPVALDDVAAHLRRFIGEHGGPGHAVVSYLGRRGARIVVVAEDGLFTDAVVQSVEVGRLTCEAAGITVDGWSREITSRITPSEADRVRMAGSGR